MAAFCSSLQLWHLMKVTLTEGWPVFVCLWAKCQQICCVCLSCHCSVPHGGRYSLRVGRISMVPLSGNWPCRARSRLLIYGINFCSPHLSVKKPATLDSLMQTKKNASMQKMPFYKCYSVLSFTVNLCYPFSICVAQLLANVLPIWLHLKLLNLKDPYA